MKSMLIPTMILSVALMTGCSGDRQQTVAGAETKSTTPGVVKTMTPEQLGQLGAEIEKNPQKAEELLTARGLDTRSFETQIRKVTESAEASRRYAEAYKRAKV